MCSASDGQSWLAVIFILFLAPKAVLLKWRWRFLPSGVLQDHPSQVWLLSPLVSGGVHLGLVDGRSFEAKTVIFFFLFFSSLFPQRPFLLSFELELSWNCSTESGLLPFFCLCCRDEWHKLLASLSILQRKPLTV